MLTASIRVALLRPQHDRMTETSKTTLRLSSSPPRGNVYLCSSADPGKNPPLRLSYWPDTTVECSMGGELEAISSASTSWVTWEITETLLALHLLVNTSLPLAKFAQSKLPRKPGTVLPAKPLVSSRQRRWRAKRLMDPDVMALGTQELIASHKCQTQKRPLPHWCPSPEEVSAILQTVTLGDIATMLSAPASVLTVSLEVIEVCPRCSANWIRYSTCLQRCCRIRLIVGGAHHAQSRRGPCFLISVWSK